MLPRLTPKPGERLQLPPPAADTVFKYVKWSNLHSSIFTQASRISASHLTVRTPPVTWIRMDQSRVVRLDVPAPLSPPPSRRTPTKTDYRKTFHLPSKQPSPQPPSEVTTWTSVRSSLYTAEDEFNKRRFSGAGRPISLFTDDSNNNVNSTATSPMESPLTRSRANSTKKPLQESSQLQPGNNSMLASYFQTSFVSKSEKYQAMIFNTFIKFMVLNRQCQSF